MKKHICISLATSLLLSFSFIGCGGGGDSSNDSSTPATQTTASTVSFSGVAVDGYISGATACLDTNINGKCESGEPTTKTQSDGSFTFSDVSLGSNTLVPVLVNGGLDTATGKLFKGQLSNIVTKEDIDNGVSLSVTPLTDLVATAFIASPIKSDTALSSIKSTVATALNIAESKVDADPMQDKEVFAKAQKVEQTKALLLSSASKAANVTEGTAEAEAMRESVSQALSASLQANSSLDTTEAFSLLESTQRVSIPTNEKEFIVKQVEEIQATLQKLVNDATVTLNALNTKQQEIESIVDVASASIDNATDDSTITVVTEQTPMVISLPTPPTPPSL